MNIRQKYSIYTILILSILLVILFYCYSNKSESSKHASSDAEEITLGEKLFIGDNLKTNTDETLIPLNEVLGGGPSKDGIPSLSNPKFVGPEETDNIPEDSLGIFIERNGIARFYPYTILVWHEIVNDVLEGEHLAITFCPLCGSAIVYDRKVNDVIHEFGVSGKLWQSNLLMYDKKTESLWSQAEGRAVVGDLSGTSLDIFPSQLITYKEAKSLSKDLKVLSQDTGYLREYGFYPYGDYEDTEKLIFPVNNLDLQLPAKTLMFAGVIKNHPVSFNREKLLATRSASLETPTGVVTARVTDDNKIILSQEGVEYPGYVTMWFSWANHNDGSVWK